MGNEEGNNKLIYAAMSNIYKSIEAIGKNKENALQKFKFRGIDDVYNSLHSIFAENGVFVIPEKISSTHEPFTTAKGGVGWSVVQTIKFHFVAADGSEVCAIVDGEGMDYSDKATSKAQSMAIKYALLQVFMIPTEDTEDTEESDKETIVAEKAHGDINAAKKAINETKTKEAVASVKSMLAKRAWTEQESIELDDAIKNAEQRIAEANQ